MSWPRAVGALLAVGAFGLLIPGGGYSPATWYPVGIFLAVILAVSLLTVRVPASVPRLVMAAALLLALYAAWSYVSIAWAGQQGDAWDGANRTALYALVFALFAFWPVGPRLAAVVLGTIGLGVAVAGLVVLLNADAASDPLPWLIDGRLSEPVGYPNAAVALWTLALFPCVLLASRRQVHPLLRGLFLGAAGLLLGLALMGQSRGWFLIAPVALLVFVVLVPGRGRVMAVTAALAVAAAGFAGPVLDVYTSLEPGADPAALMGRAAHAILLAAAVLGVGGALVALADARWGREWAPRRPSRRALVAAAGVILVVLATVAATTGQPAGEISKRLDQLKQGQSERRDPGRLTSAGSNRYDFWRVALDRFAERPVIGIGADNFQQDYLVNRHSEEEPRYPHSLELRVLLQTGLVGAILLCAALAAALLPGVRAARSRDTASGGCAAVGVAMFAYWCLHGSVDWFWEIAGLGVPAFAMLGLATSVGRREASSRDRRHARPLLHGPVSIAAVVAALGIACASFALPWISYRDVERASKVARYDPREAADKLRSADGLNPLSSRPAIYEATIALGAGRLGDAAASFERALEREPRNAFALFELGAVRGQQGKLGEAVPLLARAVALSPRDPVFREALAQARRGKRPNVADLNRQIVERVRKRYVFRAAQAG